MDKALETKALEQKVSIKDRCKMTKQFTAEHYKHLEENSFNPKICPLCLEIGTILLELSIITELHNKKDADSQDGKYCKGGV